MVYKDKPSIEELYDELYHYGMPRRSGRYPWGSGKDPYQHSGDFLSRVDELREKKFTCTDKNGKRLTGDNAIAESMGLTTTQFRTQLGLARAEQRSLDVDRAEGLRAKGYSTNKIGEIMGIAESSVRSLLDPNSKNRMNKAQGIANDLKKLVDEKGMIQVGAGVETELNISNEKLKQALYILELQGYNTFGGRVPQVTNPKQMTTIKVLCPPGTKYKVQPDGTKTSAAVYDYENIHSVTDYISRDGGKTLEKKFQYPRSLDKERLMIRYKEDGGILKDGVIELRPGVDDLDLKGNKYSQVRILVDNDRYLKGMAVYGDPKDFPDGVDVIFNTNKTKDKPMRDVLKPIKDDRDNPFGSAIKDSEQGGQYKYIDKNGKEQLGLINKTRAEGDWSEWKDKLPSQFLSKQSIPLARQQLKLASKEKHDEFDEIMSLTNPTVKKKLLQDFSDGCDSAAVHLYAAALPRQKYHVILPDSTLKDTEVYAPKYRQGEKVALIRYPHGGTFEIPVLTVNNKHAQSKKLIGSDADDAICINPAVAGRLSGADFDGDTVMVIPTNDKVNIRSSKELSDLKGFEPKDDYATTEKNGKYYNIYGDEVKIMKNTQNEMGRISNLITDMTLQGADEEKLARAVKHSMVVIDAEKHKLDYRRSYIENGIASLKNEYQTGGASTLISRAKSETSVLKRQGSPKINLKYDTKGNPNPDYDPKKPEGALLYKTADDLYYPDKSRNKDTGLMTVRTIDGKKIVYDPKDRSQYDKYNPIQVVDKDTGEVKFTNKAGDIEYRYKKRTEKSTKMQETDDAFKLVSKANTSMERIYANYANDMKALANQARKEMATAGKIEYNREANLKFRKEVDSLNAKLNEALKNKPREKQAQLIANSVIKAKTQDNPNMTKEEKKKLSQRELAAAREQVGAKRQNIKITDEEWNAIQAGAVSETTLKKILDNSDMDVLRQKATPRQTVNLPQSKINRMHSMRERGLTISEIADSLGVSSSTVSNLLKGKE